MRIVSTVWRHSCSKTKNPKPERERKEEQIEVSSFEELCSLFGVQYKQNYYLFFFAIKSNESIRFIFIFFAIKITLKKNLIILMNLLIKFNYQIY
jgi:hypothetical protein